MCLHAYNLILETCFSADVGLSMRVFHNGELMIIVLGQLERTHMWKYKEEESHCQSYKMATAGTLLYSHGNTDLNWPPLAFAVGRRCIQ